jgi:hypothetical protein
VSAALEVWRSNSSKILNRAFCGPNHIRGIKELVAPYLTKTNPRLWEQKRYCWPGFPPWGDGGKGILSGIFAICSALLSRVQELR